MDPHLTASAAGGWGGAWPLMLRVGAGLMLVLGGMMLVALLLRRFTARRRVTRDRYGPELVSSTHLGPRQALHLVRVCDRLVLVGAGRDGLSCLGTFAMPDKILAAQAPASSPSADRPSFLDYLEARLRGGAPARTHLPGEPELPPTQPTTSKLAP